MSIKKLLIEQKRQILNGGQVDVNLFKVRSLFLKFYLSWLVICKADVA